MTRYELVSGWADTERAATLALLRSIAHDLGRSGVNGASALFTLAAARIERGEHVKEFLTDPCFLRQDFPVRETIGVAAPNAPEARQGKPC